MYGCTLIFWPTEISYHGHLDVANLVRGSRLFLFFLFLDEQILAIKNKFLLNISLDVNTFILHCITCSHKAKRCYISHLELCFFLCLCFFKLSFSSLIFQLSFSSILIDSRTWIKGEKLSLFNTPELCFPLDLSQSYFILKI